MIIKKSVNLVEIIIDEVALEGLDGIALEALWQRLAIKLGYSLPLKNSFMEQIWKICLEIDDFIFYELESPRDNLIIYDGYELEYLNLDTDKDFEQKDIYLHCPVEDLKLGIRGSCSSYFTRKDISCIVKNLILSEASNRYNQKLVIVASQSLRERALIESNVSSILQLPLSHYCLLERIGRSRSIGEITIKKSVNIKEDPKALFYIRKGLQEHGLIRKQVYYQGSSGINYNGQNTGTLVHLTRFFNTRKPKVIMWAEHLINYLKSKENYAAEYTEVKNELNLDYSIKKFFKIHLLQKVFRTDLKVPYRSYYPNSAEKEWQVKNNSSKERIIKLVTLSDPNIEIVDLWRTEEIKEDDNPSQLDLQNQKLHVPFLTQIYKTVESKEFKGASQTELAVELGLTKLISRTLVRNLVKTKVVSTYLDDIGRQRTTKFVSKKFDAKSSVKKQFELEISKIKEYSRSMIVDKIKENLNDDNKDEGNTQNNTLDKTSATESINGVDDSFKSGCKFKNQIFTKVNDILWKYKLFKNKTKYKYTSKRKYNGGTKLENDSKNLNNKQANETNALSNTGILENNINANLIDSDFYKTIETKLIIQKPECKKKSQKIAVVGFLKNVQNSDNNKQSSISYRLLRRANLIIESIKEHKIIEDTQKLMKYINAEEDKEGLDVKIDKNSLIRLLQKLAEDNLIKYIKLILKNKKQTKQKIVNFICDPSIDINDTVIQSAVEQAKLKFCMTEADSARSNENIEKISASDDVTNTSNDKKHIEEKTVICKSNMLGKKYGYSPKFIRMKTMHIFLYYLIYEYPEHRTSKSVFIENLKNQGFLYDDLVDTDINIYNADINWKMFIPPLPKHKGYPIGWALMCDVLLRMPLSLFVKVHNVNFDVPGLQELLDHPIKKHFLVKDLPTPIRNMLFLKRKYMFSIHEIVSRLCYLGLVQFGPQMLKEKDQVFVYLNKRTELLDTTSSAAGYHRIEDKPYPVTRFTFSSLAVVENYWYEMWNTCINTCLGGRSVVEGKDILLEDLSRKIEMIQALKVKHPEEAEKHDTGFVPGDRKGAAGIDSAFFPHLKRNWNWVNSGQKNMEKKESRSNNSIAIAKSSSKLQNVSIRKAPQKKRCSPVKQNQVKIAVANSINDTNKLKTKRDKDQINLEFPVVACSKPPKIIRKVLPRKSMLRKRVKYDEIDFSALQRMDKLRVDWEKHEDNILLVCKVAMVYLCPNPRRNLVTFTAIRDILRSYSFTSYNKTSRACQRRLLYMLKQPRTVNSVLLGVEEVKQDYYVNKRFGGLIDRVKGECDNPIECEKRVEKIFNELVTYIAKKYYNISNMERREPIALPKTIQEFNIFHKLKLPTKTINSPGVSKEVREISDIHTTTINSVIHSSMCCGKERRSWAYQLFKVYQQYPEYLLRSAMLKIRADQMVTMKKNYMCAYKKFGNCMPMSSSQYQLSSAYYYKFQTKWPYEVFSESYNVLLSLMENYVERKRNAIDGIEVKPGVGGIVAAIHDFVGTDSIDIDIEIPDQIIMLDPTLPEKDEVYQRIASRYQSILESLSTDYAEHVKNSNIMTSQNNSLMVKQLKIDNEQRTSDQVCLSKRKENDYDFQQNKKRKLNDEKYLQISERYNEIDKPEAKKDNKNFQCIIENSDRKIHPVGDSSYENKNLLPGTSHGLCNEKIHNESMGSDLYSEQVATPIDTDITNINSVSKCQDKDDIFVVKNDNKVVESRLDSNIEDNLGKQENKIAECLSCHLESHDKASTNVQCIPCLKRKSNGQQIVQNKKKNCYEINKINFSRVNELIKCIGNRDAAETIEMRTDINDVRTRQTRIAMLKMREELHDLTFHDSHHAHEYFVVNSFKLFYSLTEKGENLGEVRTYRGLELPKSLLPINVEVTNKVLEDIKKFAIFPKYSTQYDDFKMEIMKDGQFDWEYVDGICKFIKTKAEFGATLHDIVTNFNHLNNKLAKILLLLSEKRMVLRAGIVTVRYIYYRYINPWIIHSYKILRLEKEGHQTIPEGSVYILDNEENSISKDKDAKRVTTAANLFYNSWTKLNTECENSNSHDKNMYETTDNSADIESEMSSNNANETKRYDSNSQERKAENTDDADEESKNPKKFRRNRTVLLKQKDIYRAAKLLDFNTAEEIKVVIKPWIRIDGVLNRRVLDRMLGAVLCYCIEKPGISLTIIQNRFTPAIQPYHTRELIEILVKLNCITMTIQRVSKITLFSKPAQVDLTGDPDLIADSDSIIIEPTLQATLRFGMFLSNRSYNLDFLSSF